MLSIKITNNRCEARCVYCYEHALRDAGPAAAERPLNIPAVLAQMEREWREQTKFGQDAGHPYLHGGEALLAGHEVVEIIMRKAYELAGRTNIQTYGYLIDKRYIEIFKRYNASVGISIDGPWPLNRARVVPGWDMRKLTELVHRNILWLRSEGIQVSIICVLHKLNALPEPRQKLKEWILWLRDIGVNSGRLNLMHTDYHRYGKAIELTEEEAEDAWRDLTRFVLLEQDGLYWQPMHDAVSSLLGLEQGTCVFGPSCAYYHAAAEPVILSDGTTANCLKTAKTGKMYPRYEQYDGDWRGFGGVRYEVLPLIEPQDGGCKGCRFWRNCAGGCPSEGIGGDWRNKTRFCRAYYGLFDEAEKALRRLMPNIRLTTDAKDGDFPGPGPAGMNPPAFRFMLPQYTRRPSSWRGEAVTNAIQVMQLPVQGQSAERPRSGWLSDIEHLDGTVRHLDSGHGDHNDHKDSGVPSVPAVDQRSIIVERLQQSNARLATMQEGKSRAPR